MRHLSAADARRRRLDTMLGLIAERPIHTQHELADALGRMGLAVTQATVSRDVQELGLVRTPAGYVAADGGAASQVLSFTLVQFVAVVRTPPGTANMVARSIDEAEIAGVAGTVAGDDTLIVVLADPAAEAALKGFLRIG
ncbi:MAG: arginine repressor [Candidatus Dormibacterales bacterium]